MFPRMKIYMEILKYIFERDPEIFVLSFSEEDDFGGRMMENSAISTRSF